MIRKYTASADTTIVNAYQPNLSRRGTGSNMGMADVMEVFSIYGRQQNSSSAAAGSQELSRMLVKFPITGISSERSSNLIPASGSVRFFLKLYNAQHSRTVPRDYKLVVHPVSQSWQEGVGLDLIGYKDYTKGNTGANWIARNSSDTPGITKYVFASATPSDYGAGAGANYVVTHNGSSVFNLWFDDGAGDSAPSATGAEVEIDITGLGSTAAIAGKFRTTLNDHSNFSANIIGSTVLKNHLIPLLTDSLHPKLLEL